MTVLYKKNTVENRLCFALFLKITLAGNKTDFEEFTLLSRRASWVRLTVTKVYDGSGGVGITEIEFYNDMCKQSKLLLDKKKQFHEARNQLIEEDEILKNKRID